MVLVGRDTNADGTPDQRYRPLYDTIGNVALLLDENGEVIERYAYSPYGDRSIFVNDLTPPAVEQVRVVGDEVWVELSEELSRPAFSAAVDGGLVTLEETAGPTPVAFDWSLPVDDGPLAGRRLVLTPTTAPAAATEVRLTMAAGALRDLFRNETAAATDLVFDWTPAVVTDGAAPEVVRLAVDGTGKLEVTFSEPTDPATVDAAFLVDGSGTTWTAATDGYTWVSDTGLLAGSHTVRIETTLADEAGSALAQVWEETFTVDGTVPARLLFLAADPNQVTASTVGNRYGFHGRPEDGETGLFYFRNRYFEPELGRFVTVDPLGFVDGVNVYQYVLNNPSNNVDAMGLVCPECRTHSSPSAASLEEWERNEEFFFTYIWTTRVQGGFMVLVGLGEELAGVAGLLVPEPTPVTKIAGAACMLHGADVIQAGWNQMCSGVPTETLTHTLAAEAAEEFGADEELADALGTGVDIGIGVAGSLKSLRAASGLGRAATSTGMKRVGRWMSREELAEMTRTGRLQEGGGGQTRLVDPTNPNAYTNAPRRDVYVEFDVPANRVLPHSEGTYRVPGPNSPDARVPGRSPSTYEMPLVERIEMYPDGPPTRGGS